MHKYAEAGFGARDFEQLRSDYERLKQKIVLQCPECCQAKFRDLFLHAASAIVVLDKSGKIILANKSFHEITGYSASDVMGMDMAEFLAPHEDIEGRAYLVGLFSGEAEKTSLHLQILDRENEILYLDMSVASVPESEESPRSTICIFDDVTTDRESEVYREELIEELMEAKELQEDNAAQLTMLLHELDLKNLELQKEIAERKKAEEKLRESEERFKSLSITDQLTGLYNRRHMIEVAEREVEALSEVERPLSFILMDIDDFKSYNDTYGHAEGDVVLENVGRIIKSCIRYTDKAFRYGGEEFLIILPGTDGQKAACVAEAIRKEVARAKYFPKGSEPVSRTMSIGVAQFMPGEPLERVLKRADDNMYNSKIRGKNKVFFACETGSCSFS